MDGKVESRVRKKAEGLERARHIDRIRESSFWIKYNIHGK